MLSPFLRRETPSIAPSSSSGPAEPLPGLKLKTNLFFYELFIKLFITAGIEKHQIYKWKEKKELLLYSQVRKFEKTQHTN